VSGGPNPESKVRRWYDRDAAKEALATAILALKTRGIEPETRVLADGRLAFIIKRPRGQTISIIFDDQHPEQAPVVQVTGAAIWQESRDIQNFIVTIDAFFAAEGIKNISILA
jgi:hypothetical protein